MRQTDKRRRSPAQKERTRRGRQARADKRRRQTEWQTSTQAARRAGYMLDAHITVIAEWENIEAISAALWRRMRRLMQRNGLPFMAMRAPEYTPRRGHHMHMAQHLPERLYGDVASALEAVTGTAMARWFDVSGKSLGNVAGVVCMAADGSWMLQRHVDGLGGSDERLVQYASKSDGKHKTVGRHQRSAALVELTHRFSATSRGSAQHHQSAPAFIANGHTEHTQSAV